MENGRKTSRCTGRFLPDRRQDRGPCTRWFTAGVLLVWDGILIYMIAECLIVPVYGAVFVAVLSVYLGNQM